MAKFNKVTVMAAIVGISALIASQAVAYNLGVDTTFHPSPAMQPAPPPPPPPSPAPRVDLRPPSIINPPASNPNTVRRLPPLPPAAPPRFEGGAVVVPTPTGGAAGSAVLRDNKNGVTFDAHGRTERSGYSVNGGISAPLPETK